jgi:hypothetical protein
MVLPWLNEDWLEDAVLREGGRKLLDGILIYDLVNSLANNNLI